MLRRTVRSIAVGRWLAPLFLGACGGEPDSTAVEPPKEASARSLPALAEEADAADDRAGHRRMVALLEEVAVRTPEHNSYLGTVFLRSYREQLEALPPQAPDWHRAKLHFLVGLAELRQGETERALEELEASKQLIEGVPVQEHPKFVRNLDYQLGVASLRLGENQNCVDRHTPRSCILPIEGDGVHAEQEGSRQAIRHFERVLSTHSPEEAKYLSARWLLNVAYLTLGEHPDGVPKEQRIAPEKFRSRVEFPRFADIAEELGLDTFNMCGGSLVEDFNGDGFLDLMNSTWDPVGQVRLFASNGDGTFTDRTGMARIEGIVGGLNLVQSDYDNDGDIDVLVLRGAWLFGPQGQVPNSLLRNDGHGTFTDVTFAAGLGDQHYPTQTAAFADYDLDGDLDLYIGNEALLRVPFPSQLFRNEGDGTFTDVSEAAGVTNLRYAKGVSWGDIDGDRYPDLFVSNLDSKNRLYHNQGDGTFTDIAEKAGVGLPNESFPAWFWDFDNDGALDLYVSSYYQSEKPGRLAPFVASFLGLEQRAETAALYRGNGHGQFTDVTQEQGLDPISFPMGANFGDLDNDGFLDFYLGTGYPDYDGLMPNVMYWNRRGQRFDDVSAAGGFAHVQKGHGVSFADLDNDGDQDVFEQMGGAFQGGSFSNVLYENPGFGNHWIKLKLVGVRSNRCAMGTRIRLDLTEAGKTRTVYKHVNTGGSFGGNPLVQHLGLGQASQIDRLEIYWPASDTTQHFENVAADQYLRITEGETSFTVVEQRPAPFAR